MFSINHLEQELKEYDIRCSGDGEGSIPDFLWQFYYNGTPMDDGWIRRAEDAIAPVFGELSTDTSDMLFGLVSSLITAYQRAALPEGIQVGFHLHEELRA